ncbi:hypothetical protein GF362_01955 [Candidatus Dojkabacteria bacterium]|nr:hypothetical protein [Candidatus Dojkabacteria bacterium]
MEKAYIIDPNFANMQDYTPEGIPVVGRVQTGGGPSVLNFFTGEPEKLPPVRLVDSPDNPPADQGPTIKYCP